MLTVNIALLLLLLLLLLLTITSQVILHEPDVKKKKETIARLNCNNNIEWNVEIPADSTAKIKLRYSIEFPLNMDVTGLI